MKVIDDFKTSEWLEQLPRGPEAFDWDDGNKYKNLKHGVTGEDIESLLEDFIFHGKIVGLEYGEDRYVLLGRDRGGRRLTLIFTRRGDMIRPISCRPMRHEERDIYEEKTA